MVTNGAPFDTTDNANVLDGQNGEEEVFVGPVVPISIAGKHDGGRLILTTNTCLDQWWVGGSQLAFTMQAVKGRVVDKS